MNMSATLLDLGTQPLVNNLCLSREESLNAKRYSLKAEYHDDLTVHLDTEIPPDILYKNYLYNSGVSLPYVEHCREMYNSCKHLSMKVMIDIGGNDGTLLRTFREESKVNTFWSSVPPEILINVDASKSFREKNEQDGIEYVCDFFSDKLDLPKANLITSTNVFQHTKDVHFFMRGIQKHLDGLWILEFPYTYNTLSTLQFDQFYHEHYYYWLVTPLEKLFHQYGLKIIHISEHSIHGGSLRMWMTNKNPSSSEISNSIVEYKKRESELLLSAFSSNVKTHIEKSKDFIFNLPGKTAFFGAAAKGCVFLNALEITIHNMPDSYIIDDTLEKQGLFFPGTGFEICNRQTIIDKPVDNIIILAHNFKDYIVKSLRESNFTGNIITMFPSVEINLI
jgi:hypothetical protein